MNPCLAKWQVLCIFKALQEIYIRKKKSDNENGSDPTPHHVEIDELTVEEFYNFYEALDFKWIAPVCKELLNTVYLEHLYQFLFYPAKQNEM